MDTPIEMEGTWNVQNWIKATCKKHGQHGPNGWKELTLEERKGSLIDLWKKEKSQCKQAIQYLVLMYPQVPLDDLKGTKENPCLVVRCPTDLALQVLNTNPEVFTIAIIPTLIMQKIKRSKLTKLIKAAKEKFNSEVGHPGALSANEACDISAATVDDHLGPTFFKELEGVAQEFTNIPKNSDLSLFTLDEMCQVTLATYGSVIDFNTFHPEKGNALHMAAKFGLTEMAKEILSQGYKELLLEPATHGEKMLPLSLAVWNEQWRVVAVFLEALSCSQRKVQASSIREEIKCREIIDEIAGHEKPWWSWSPLKNEKLHKREELKGRVMLIEAVLDTTVHGPEVYTDFLLDCGNEDQTDGADSQKHPATNYQRIADCGVEELQAHPGFTAVVDYKWRRSYGYLHGLLFILYVLFLVCLTSFLTLASKTSDPREYRSGWDGLRLFCEIMSLLYIIVVATLNSIRISYQWRTTFKAQGNITNCKDIIIDKATALLEQVVTPHNAVEVCRYTSTLLIIPLRIAGSDWQWTLASLAIILNGMRLLHYATVLPYMGGYIGTLLLMLKQDIPRIIGVFLVIIFSFGGGLYFALVGHYSSNDVDMINDNSTSEIYLVWATGIRMLVEGSILTYYGSGGFNWSGVIIYWMLVFAISVAFIAVLTAQFSQSFEELAAKAHVNVIIKKAQIIRKMEDMFILFPKGQKCLTKLRGQHKHLKRIERRTLANEQSGEVELKEYFVHEMNKRFAECERRDQKLLEMMEKKMKGM